MESVLLPLKRFTQVSILAATVTVLGLASSIEWMGLIHGENASVGKSEFSRSSKRRPRPQLQNPLLLAMLEDDSVLRHLA